ncbi:MAG: hypothetical protein AB8E82_07285 [Aureispira sp.]
MVFGIIAEGKGDVVVIENVLWSITDDEDEIRVLRPEELADETDLQNQYKTMTADEFSSWTLVKEDCVKREKFHLFLEKNPLEEERKIILHLDTAECELEGYGVTRPIRAKGQEQQYCTVLRQAVINQINTWLEGRYQGQLLYAICIEEMEAWLLPLYEQKDSSTRPDPKRHLTRILDKKKATDKKFKKQYESKEKQGVRALQTFLSKNYQKKKHLTNALTYNQSLANFVESI